MHEASGHQREETLRQPRPGEYVCRCTAYKFPHRFGGGHCNGRWIVEEYVAEHQGSGDCSNCHNWKREEHYCEVERCQERVTLCPVWHEFVCYHEIILYGKQR